MDAPKARATGVPWPIIGGILLYVAAFWAFLLCKPAQHTLVMVVDDGASAVGGLLAFLLAAGRPRRRLPHDDGADTASPSSWGHRLAPLLLGLGPLSYAAGTGLWAYEELILRQPPFPSWSDAAYLSAYPLLLLGILSLPRRPLAAVARTRIVLESLMAMAVAATFSWYLVLGPTVLQAGEALIAKAVGAAYPLSDLVLIVCVLVLWGRAGATISRPVVAYLSLGLLIVVVVDSLFDILTLRGVYATGSLIDPLWALGYLFIGLGARSARLAERRRAVRPVVAEGQAVAQIAGEGLPELPLSRILLPYALLPAIGALVLCAWRDPNDRALEPGVYAGAAALMLLFSLRQVLALLENRRLCAHLRDAYVQMARRNDHLERLTIELRAMHTDNDALTALNARLEAAVSTDALTGLPNRVLLHERLERELQVARPPQAPLALLLIDLDRFKEVNDTLGHHYGDHLLRQVGARLRAAIRATDTVARLGGDEFAILLPGADAAAAIRLAETLLNVLGAPLDVEGLTLDVEGSIGIALFPDHGADATSLLRQADVAMYVSKRAHGGYTVYDAGHDHHSPRRLALMTELRAALTEDKLVLHYQPQARLSDGRVVGVEALLRWPHPTRGFIPPDEFIPVAEHTGLIAPLTEWVLRTALGQARAWADDGQTFGVAVNLSARTLHDLSLPDLVDALLKQYAVAPARLTLEVTESALMLDRRRAQEVLLRLSTLGVRLAIDDFGSGYSSLAYLKGLPVDELKIDKSFILGMGTAEGFTGLFKGTAIVRSVVAMAHALGLTIVAEGVETRATWQFLADLRCDVAQGYYLSQPLPAAELDLWAPNSGRGFEVASA